MTVERPRLHWKYLWDAVLLAILVAVPCFFAAKAAAQAPQPVTPAPAPSWQNILIDGSVTVPAPQPMPATEAAGGKSGAGESGDAADISITVPVPVPTRPGAPPAEPPRLPAFSRLLPIEPPVVRSTPSATPSSIQLVSAPVGNSTAQLSTPLIQDRAPLSDVTAPSPAPAQIPIGPPGVTPLPGQVNPGGVVFPPMEGNSAAPGKQGTSLPAPGALLPEPRLIGPQPGIPEQVPFPYPPSGSAAARLFVAAAAGWGARARRPGRFGALWAARGPTERRGPRLRLRARQGPLRSRTETLLSLSQQDILWGLPVRVV